MNITVFSSFKDLPESCKQLFVYAEKFSPFFGDTWYSIYQTNVADKSHQVRLYVVYAGSIDETPLAVFPMQTTKKGSNELSSLSNYYSSLYSPIINQSADLNEVMLCFSKYVFAETPKWSILNINPMDQDGQVYQSLVSALKQTGMLVQPYFCFGNWYLDLDGMKFCDYFHQLPSRLKNTVKRKTKKLEKNENAEILIITEPADVDSAMDGYEAIYDASWKQQEPYKEFIRKLVHAYARKGNLRLGLATVDGVPAAAQIWFVTHGIASIFKLAYNESYAKLSLGSILSTKLMQCAIDDDHVTEIDYLTGDDAYKKEWMSDRRERWGVMAFNPRTIRGMVSAIRHLTPGLIKKMFK